MSSIRFSHTRKGTIRIMLDGICLATFATLVEAQAYVASLGK